MASVEIDSELMTNYISAASVASGQFHVAALDENRMPMLFILENGTRPKLNIIRKDALGQSQQFSVGKLIGLPESAVIQSFNAQQDWNLKLYLVVAYRNSDSTSALVVVKPFHPQELQEDAAGLSCIPGDQTIGTVQDIHMAPLSGTNTDYEYPDVFLVHKQLNRATSWGSDIKHIRVQDGFASWIATQELETPLNVSEILDIAPAISPYGQGLYVLYVAQGMTRIFARFLRPDPYATDGTMHSFVTDVMCPKGARCIATFLDSDGFTKLLVSSAEGVRCLSKAESTAKNRPGTLTFDAEPFKNIRQLYTVQDGEDLTLWFKNVQGDLGYTRTKISNLKADAVTSMILPASLSTIFAPVVTSGDNTVGRDTRQMVISNDRDGNLSLLEQSSDIGLWRKTPFMAPSSAEPTELKSYTITIKPQDAQKAPLSNGSVLLSASSSLTVICNGRHTLLQRVPTWFDCDSTGSLDFIVPSDSLGSQGILIDSVRNSDGEILDMDQVYYDPADKPMAQMMEKLSKVQSDDDFKSLKNSKGENLLSDDVRGNKDTVTAANTYLRATTEAYTRCSMVPPTTFSPSRSNPSAQSFSRSVTVASKGLGDLFMDGWNWVREKIEDVTEWVVEAAGAVWNFVCKIAGEVKTFVLDCVEKICEAATWVWEKVKVGWNKLCDFIGFLFNWKDIVNTKNTISAVLSAGCDYAAAQVDSLALQADQLFDRLEDSIDHAYDTQYDTSRDTAGPETANSESNDVKNSTAVNWVRERAKNSGSGTDAEVRTTGGEKSDEATDFWNNDIVPAVQKLYGQLDKIGSDITALFKKKGSISTQEIKDICRQILKSGVLVLRTTVKALLKAVAKFAGLLKDLGNYEITWFKLITWVYKKMSGDHALTIFDVLSLVIAIPTTVISKLITGKAPPVFPQMSGAFLNQLYRTGGLDAQTKSDWAVFKAEIAIGISLTASIYKVIKLLWQSTKLDDEKLAKSLSKGPTTFLRTASIVYNMLGALIAFPTDDGLPGESYRNIIGLLTCARAGWHTVALFAKSDSKAKIEEPVYYLDTIAIITSMVFALLAGFEEHKEGKRWKDYQEGATNRGMVATVLTTVSGIAYFTAWKSKDKNPSMAAISVGVMCGAAGVTGIINADIFRAKYKKLQAPHITTAPSF